MLDEGAGEAAKKGILRRGDEREQTIDLMATLHVLWRRRVLVSCTLLVFLSGAAIYLAVATPRYAATSMLLFDIRKIEPFDQRGYPDAATESSFVDSQVEVLRSETLARSVIHNLDLISDSEFAQTRDNGFIRATIGKIVSFVLSDKDVLHPNQLVRCIRVFQKNATIKRVGLTYIISIEYRSLDPNKAARISNAIAETYIANELESKAEAARRANDWLQDRLRELRTLTENTEKAVVAYKAKAPATDAEAAHLDEQQLANVSTQRRILLRDLESSAQTYRTLHETLLQRVAEFTEQQTYPAMGARIVSTALPPLEKSEPQGLLVLGMASLVGLAAGVGAAFARDYVDGGLRSPTEVEQKTGINCLGVLPAITGVDGPVKGRDPLADASGRNLQTSVDGVQHGASHTQESQPVELDRHISANFPRYRLAVDKPLSRFAETIRSLRVAAEIAGPADHCKTIGVTSALPLEGKSLVAANLGGMIAATGNRVLIIDANPRSPVGLTQRLAPEAKAGVLEAAAGGAQPKALVWRDRNTNLDFLPIVRPIPDKYCSAIASPSAMRRVLEVVQQDYDYVVVDLPSIVHASDVKAVSHSIDYFILVIRCGFSSQSTVLEALKMVPLVFEKLLGAVLNKADLAAHSRTNRGYYSEWR